jgi:hypothetical protein
MTVTVTNSKEVKSEKAGYVSFVTPPPFFSSIKGCGTANSILLSQKEQKSSLILHHHRHRRRCRRRPPHPPPPRHR